MKDELEKLYNLLRDLRRLEYFTNQKAFSDLFNKSSESMKITIVQMFRGAMSDDSKLRIVCIDGIHDLIKHENRADVTIRTLRDEAYILGIKSWSRLSKDGLIKRIKEYHDSRKSSSPSDGT